MVAGKKRSPTTPWAPAFCETREVAPISAKAAARSRRERVIMVSHLKRGTCACARVVGLQTEVGGARAVLGRKLVFATKLSCARAKRMGRTNCGSGRAVASASGGERCAAVPNTHGAFVRSWSGDGLCLTGAG